LHNSPGYSFFLFLRFKYYRMLNPGIGISSSVDLTEDAGTRTILVEYVLPYF